MNIIQLKETEISKVINSNRKPMESVERSVSAGIDLDDMQPDVRRMQLHKHTTMVIAFCHTARC